MTPADLVGKLRNLHLGHFAALLGFSLTGYSPDVADHSAIGLGNPTSESQQRAQHDRRRFYGCNPCVMAAVRGTSSDVPVS